MQRSVSKRDSNKGFTYLVLSGNESVLIREALERRSWWSPSSQPASPWNLWWGGNGQAFPFKAFAGAPKLMQVVNRLENHRELCTKSGLAANLELLVQAHRQQHKQPQAASAPKAAPELASGCSTTTQQQTHQQLGSGDCPITSMDNDGGSVGRDQGRDASTSYGSHASPSWIPETHVLCGGSVTTAAAAASLQSFREAYARAKATGHGGTWIIKPVSLNRGIGIEVFNQLEDTLAYVESKKAGSKWVVQKYIERPLLVGGRKFDIRAYVLYAPDGRVYLHKEAYVRTSCTPYVLDDLSDKSAHLTNDAVQKKLGDYHAFEDHCKLSLADLPAAAGLLADGCTLDLESSVWPQMRACVARLFGVAAPKLNPRGLQFCYELLGLDFMIDMLGQVYLIEVNTSPALFRAGAYLTDLLPRVIEEVVQRAVDPWFPPPASSQVQLPAPLDGFQEVQLIQTAYRTNMGNQTTSSLQKPSSCKVICSAGASTGNKVVCSLSKKTVKVSNSQSTGTTGQSISRTIPSKGQVRWGMTSQ